MVDTPTSDLPSVGELPESSTLDMSTTAAEVAAVIEAEMGDEVTLSNGIVLKLRPVPPLALREAAIRVPPPQVPVVFIESKGREEPNPADPDYLQALVKHEAEQIFRIADVLMLLGTSVGSLPDGKDPPESDEWIEVLGALDLTVDRENKYKRYLAWLRLYAVPSEEDIARILYAVVQMSGVTEVEVARAAAAFRRSS